MRFFLKCRQNLLICIALFLHTPVLNAQLIFKKNQYSVDKNLHLIICNQPPSNLPLTTTSISFDRAYTLYSPINTIQIGVPYIVYADSIAYKLYFTRLPLINLSLENQVNDNYEGGLISVTDTTGQAISSNMGIKLRGSYSRTLPKKSYHIQLWTDSTGLTTQNKSFFGLRSDQTWLLLAMDNEKLRLNNKTSHDLWIKMDTLYYASQEPSAHSSIRSRYVEVFINSAYQGVYLFTEDLDRKELALKKQTTSDARGELYKGETWDQGTLFTGLTPLPTSQTLDWSGWELTYPDTTNWVNLYHFTDFVVNSSDSVFKQQISKTIRQDNFADYFIFLNLLHAEDNVGKNLYLARYDQNEPYFISVWDLDGTWGYYWDGSTRDITDGILSNGLFDRLLNVSTNFKLQVASRWFTLRKTILSIDSLHHAIDLNYNLLAKNGVYDRENLIWAGPLLSYGPDELNYIKDWTDERVSYLDGYFESLAREQPIIYSFTAKAVEKTAVLNWRMNCMAISSFIVERSIDGLNWNAINSTPIPSNDSLPCQYSFADNNPNPGNSYYRLKITDKQNSNSFSAIQVVNFDLPVTVFPNPASTTVRIQGNVNKVDVYSLNGALLYQSTNASPNTVDVRNLTTGTYLLHVFEQNGTISTHKILVNR